jgi:putative two-component system response regulator
MNLDEQLLSRATVLVVDDEAANLQVMRRILQPDYSLMFAKDGRQALELAERHAPDLILLDVMMPGLSGYEVCRQLKCKPACAGIPVIFVSSLDAPGDEVEGFDVGGVDYIAKPLSPALVRARVRTHLSLVNARQLRESRLQIIQRLSRAAEYKDNDTGLHVIRMSHYARLLASSVGLGREFADELLHAAPLHDVGKIGIPDEILKKKGSLTEAEMTVMRTHTLIGANIIGQHDSSLLRMAGSVALSHHERWDGSGYPHQLAGEAIPIEARIVAVADVFDALTSRRPYKEPWPLQEALDWLARQAGSHFDPALVAEFGAQQERVRSIAERWAESF